MKTNIYINMRFLTIELTGVQRFSYQISLALDQLIEQLDYLKDIEFIGLIPNLPIKKSYAHSFKNIQIQKCGFFKNGHLWEQFDLLYRVKNNFLINLTSLGPIFKKNQSVCIHDLALYNYPQLFKPAVRFIYRNLVDRFLIKNSKNIFTVSEFSKNEICKYLNLDYESITIIPNGIDHFVKIHAHDLSYYNSNLVSKKYFLLVASRAVHKNIQYAINAFQRLNNMDFMLVIVGNKSGRVFSSVDLKIESSNILMLGYIEDEYLKSLYANAYAFIFPSLYEGFGIPPLEAMFYDCPVLASNKSSIPEVCENAALYFDPTNIDDLVSKMNQVIKNDCLRIELINKGRQNIKRRLNNLNWKNSAEKMINVIINGII